MKAIIDGIKANLPIIAAVLAFGVAAAIVAYLLVRYFKNKSKKTENVGEEAGFPTGNEAEEATSDDNLFTDKNGADDSVAATETEENKMKDKKAETAKTTKSASKAEEKMLSRPHGQPPNPRLKNPLRKPPISRPLKKRNP